MFEPNPLSQRELFYQAFPRWIVDWFLAPFEDESGLLAVLVKNAGVGLTIGFVLVEAGSKAVLLRAIEVVGLTLVVLILSSALFSATRGKGDWED